jgi:hypothetical protein
MCFVEVEEEARAFFDEVFARHEVSFVDRLDEVPEDIEVLSVFITEKIDGAFLDDHPRVRLIASPHAQLVATISISTHANSAGSRS